MRQSAPPGSMLSEIKDLPAFFGSYENEYPLKVGTVVFSDLTTTQIRKLTMRFEVVIYEQGVIEGKALDETLKNMISAVEKVITDFSPLLV
jgi:hypothetical protein